MKSKMKKVKGKTIKFSKLKALSFCNSKRLPRRILINGEIREWVGIGWIHLDDEEPNGTEIIVIEG